MSAAAAAPAAANGAQHDANSVATFAKLHPREFHRKFLQHSVRPDGRSLTAVRPTTIAADSISTSAGSSLVKLGATSVVCALKLEVGKPFDTRPQDGRLAVEVHLGPLCSPKFKAARATESSVALSQWITNAVINSGALDLSDLSIVSGASCWVIYADLLCLNFDGNLADCALLALMQALRRLRLPDTEVVEDASGGRGAGKGGVAHSEVCISSTSSRPLPPKRTLLPTSFGVLEEQLLADCNGAEEELLSGMLTVVVDQTGTLVQVHKPGGTPLTDAQLNACIAVAQARVPVLLPLLK